LLREHERNPEHQTKYLKVMCSIHDQVEDLEMIIHAQLVEDLEIISHAHLVEDLQILEKMSGITNVNDSISCWASIRES